MYNAWRHQFSSEAGGRKGVAFERFSFQWSTSITFLMNMKRMSYPRLCDCSRGLFVCFKGLQNNSNHIVSFVRCWISPFPTDQNYSLNIFWAKSEKHLVIALLFHVQFVSVWSCLPLQSSLHLVSATWRKTLFYQVVSWDHSRVPCISATLLKNNLALRDHFQPTLGRQISMP